MSRARIDGFAAAQAQYDAQEEPNHGEPLVFPCVLCGEDVGERYSRRVDMYFPARVCPTCERPLCATCANRDEEISERCAECCASRTAAATCVGVVEMVEEKESEHT